LQLPLLLYQKEVFSLFFRLKDIFNISKFVLFCECDRLKRNLGAGKSPREDTAKKKREEYRDISARTKTKKKKEKWQNGKEGRKKKEREGRKEESRHHMECSRKYLKATEKGGDEEGARFVAFLDDRLHHLFPLPKDRKCIIQVFYCEKRVRWKELRWKEENGILYSDVLPRAADE